jgi:hypothetical protein
MFVYFAPFAFFTTVLPKSQFSCTLYRWACSSLLCLKRSTSNHQPRPVVLLFRPHKGIQISQNNSVSVLNGNVNAHWNSLIIQPLSSCDSVLHWCDKSWTHIASLKTKSCTRSYLTQATDTHPSLATGTVARRPIHGRLVQCRVETESDSPAVQLTFVRRWMKIQLQLEHRLHVLMCNSQLPKHKDFLFPTSAWFRTISCSWGNKYKISYNLDASRIIISIPIFMIFFWNVMLFFLQWFISCGQGKQPYSGRRHGTFPY